MKLEVTFTITFEGPKKNLEIEDFEKWSRGFSGSVSEFAAELKQFIESQPIVKSCETYQRER